MEILLKLTSIILGALLLLPILYRRYIERVNLFELDDSMFVADTLKWLPDAVQSRIYARGSMTRHQWNVLRQKQMRSIEAAL